MAELGKTNSSFEPNLTTINYFGRLFVRYGLAFLVILMVGRVLLSAAVNYWKATHPAPPPAPTVGFGVLPAPQFPAQSSEEKPNNYELEIVAGLNDSVDQAKVFLVTRNSVNLLDDQKVKTVAEDYGFTSEPEIIADQEYRFTKSSPLDMSLEISSLDWTFSLRSNYLSRADLLTQENRLPEEFEAVNTVKDYLSRADLLGSDMATASGKVSFLKSLGGELTSAVAYSDADFIQVDLNRSPIDGLYPLYTAKGSVGIVSAILSGLSLGNSGIVQMDNFYRPVDYLNVQTYPLRGFRSAWKIVQAGEAYIASGPKTGTVTVRSAELAYYDDFEYQRYLQPIYVFKGDNDFMAFVPAISAEYLQKE